MQLDVLRQTAILKTGPEYRMLNFGNAFNQFALAIGNPHGVVEQVTLKLAGGDIGKLVNGGGEHRAALLPKIFREVGAAAEKTDPYGCARNNHDDPTV